MEKRSLTLVFERGTSPFFAPGNQLAIHDQKILARERLLCRGVKLIPYKPNGEGKVSICFHSRPKKEIEAIDIELFDYLIMLPDFVNFLLENTAEIKKGDVIMIICTGTKIPYLGLNLFTGIKVTVGENDAETITIAKEFYGELPGVSMYEMAYHAPQEIPSSFSAQQMAVA